MLEYSILFLLSLISIYCTVQKLPNTDNFVYSLLYIGFITPLSEEAIFRSVLKNALTDVPYNIYINSLLFGLVHLLNYQFIPDKKIIIFQFFMTTYMGYLCTIQESFLYSYLIHMSYNVFLIIVSYSIVYYQPKDIIADEITPDETIMIIYRSKTVDDMLSSKIKFKTVKKSKLQPDQLNRIKLLETVSHKKCRNKIVN
jgi:hypothetical protein